MPRRSARRPESGFPVTQTGTGSQGLPHGSPVQPQTSSRLSSPHGDTAFGQALWPQGLPHGSSVQLQTPSRLSTPHGDKALGQAPWPQGLPHGSSDSNKSSFFWSISSGTSDSVATTPSQVFLFPGTANGSQGKLDEDPDQATHITRAEPRRSRRATTNRPDYVNHPLDLMGVLEDFQEGSESDSAVHASSQKRVETSSTHVQHKAYYDTALDDDKENFDIDAHPDRVSGSVTRLESDDEIIVFKKSLSRKVGSESRNRGWKRALDVDVDDSANDGDKDDVDDDDDDDVFVPGRSRKRKADAQWFTQKSDATDNGGNSQQWNGFASLKFEATAQASRTWQTLSKQNDSDDEFCVRADDGLNEEDQTESGDSDASDEDIEALLAEYDAKNPDTEAEYSGDSDGFSDEYQSHESLEEPDSVTVLRSKSALSNNGSKPEKHRSHRIDEFRAIDLGDSQPIQIQEDRQLVEDFKKDVLHVIRYRRNLALADEIPGDDWYIHPVMRKFQREETEESLLRWAIVGFGMRIEVLADLNEDNAFMSLPRPTNNELTQWGVYGITAPLKRASKGKYEGSSRNKFGIGNRFYDYERLMRRKYNDDPPTKQDTSLHVTRVLLEEAEKVHVRLMATFNKLDTPPIVVQWMEGILVDLYCTIEKNYNPIHPVDRDRRYHSLTMGETSTKSCPPGRRDPPWLGLNHCHPFVQGCHLMQTGLTKGQILTKMGRCCPACLKIKPDDKQGCNEFRTNTFNDTVVSGKYICKPCSVSHYKYTIKGWKEPRILDYIRNGVKHNDRRSFRNAEMQKVGNVCPCCQIVKTIAPGYAQTWAMNSLDRTILDCDFICRKCNENWTEMKVGGMTDADYVKYRRQHSQAAKSSWLANSGLLCPVCLQQGEPDVDRWRLIPDEHSSAFPVDSRWCCSKCEAFLYHRRKQGSISTGDWIQQRRNPVQTVDEYIASVDSVCQACQKKKPSDGKGWRPNPLNKSVLDVPVVCQACFVYWKNSKKMEGQSDAAKLAARR